MIYEEALGGTLDGCANSTGFVSAVKDCQTQRWPRSVDNDTHPNCCCNVGCNVRVCVLLIEVARTVTSLLPCNSIGIQLVRKEKKTWKALKTGL